MSAKSSPRAPSTSASFRMTRAILPRPECEYIGTLRLSRRLLESLLREAQVGEFAMLILEAYVVEQEGKKSFEGEPYTSTRIFRGASVEGELPLDVATDYRDANCEFVRQCEQDAREFVAETERMRAGAAK